MRQFKLFAESIEDTLNGRMTILTETFEDLGDVFEAQADALGAKFPFVTVPSIEAYLYHARRRSGAEAISYAPLVWEYQRDEWEEYAWNEQGWLQESREIFRHKEAADPVYLDGSISHYIYQLKDGVPEPVNSTGPGPYLPLYHLSPPPFNPAIVGRDAFSLNEYATDLSAVIAKNGRFVLRNSCVDDAAQKQ